MNAEGERQPDPESRSPLRSEGSLPFPVSAIVRCGLIPVKVSLGASKKRRDLDGDQPTPKKNWLRGRNGSFWALTEADLLIEAAEAMGQTYALRNLLKRESVARFSSCSVRSGADPGYREPTALTTGPKEKIWRGSPRFPPLLLR